MTIDSYEKFWDKFIPSDSAADVLEDLETTPYEVVDVITALVETGEQEEGFVVPSEHRAEWICRAADEACGMVDQYGDPVAPL